ncbi:hypothetical protein PEPS_07380 [Persicobacter psychrovividus]|uniref:Uncharacterized protein n=1 Tax=Persicobacter psychrovividus TaxID=387638 RepID=A0ABM7VC48_9BACT|nr:hypothetical protein PEPS_07380 [Persicobacter psychrovividus]
MPLIYKKKDLNQHHKIQIAPENVFGFQDNP